MSKPAALKVGAFLHYETELVADSIDIGEGSDITSEINPERGDLVLYQAKDGSDRFCATIFLDYAEDRARLRIDPRVTDRRKYVNRFVQFNERPPLGSGTFSRADMVAVPYERYPRFDKQRRKGEAVQADDEDIRALVTIERTSSKRGPK